MEMPQTKVWFITGTSSGLGRSIAEEVLARGDRLVATARDPRALAELVTRAPERVLAVKLDVTSAADIEAALGQARARFGTIDVLVNNAGYGMVGAVEETPEAELRALMDTLFFGAVALTRAVLPSMRERRRGTIVQMSSMGGLLTYPGFGAYCAAKHALEAISESLAVEVQPLGIRVLVVEPGSFRTRLFGGGFRAMPELAAYGETVGPIRAYAGSSDGTQGGDPAKAARAIAAAVDGGAARLRLPLGADAVAAIRKQLSAIASDVDAAEPVADATAF